MQFDQLKRRAFISLLGGAAAAWPLAARAQGPMPVIGFLSGLSPDASASFVAAFHRGLNETGFMEGRNVAIEFRWAEGRYERLPALAADLLQHKPAVLVATGGPNSGRAAKAATATIPIVFVTGDAVREGLVQSLNRPGGNATGVGLLQTELESKRLGLLRELAPSATVIGVLLNPSFAVFNSQLQDVQEAASRVGQQIHVLRASNEPEIDHAFARMAELRAGALLVAADPYFFILRDRITALAALRAIPAIYETHDYARAGGLASYGVSIAEAYRQVGGYTGRILKGEKPADLPVLQPTKFEFVINLKTAQALGLAVPLHLQQLADELLE